MTDKEALRVGAISIHLKIDECRALLEELETDARNVELDPDEECPLDDIWDCVCHMNDTLNILEERFNIGEPNETTT